MRRKPWAIAALVMLMPAIACAEMEAPFPAIEEATVAEIDVGPIPADAAIAEIMHGWVMPAADVLWDATAVYITAAGEDDRSPRNDQEWQAVDHARIVLEEAIQALLVPGRPVDVPGAAAHYPEEDLTPEEIQALIRKEPEVWTAMVHALNETVQQAKNAIAEQDVEALTEIGGAIDDACESCHLHFWYPEH